MKKLGHVDFQSGKGDSSNQYVLHIPISGGMGSEPIPYGLSEGMGSERIRGERRELILQSLYQVQSQLQSLWNNSIRHR